MPFHIFEGGICFHDSMHIIYDHLKKKHISKICIGIFLYFPCGNSKRTLLFLPFLIHIHAPTPKTKDITVDIQIDEGTLRRLIRSSFIHSTNTHAHCALSTVLV